jgi:anti-sigma factor RsiW
MRTPQWHVPDEELRRYADGTLARALFLSTDAHLLACPDCRARLAGADPELVRAGWARLDSELDAPVPGPVERLLLRVGVPDHTARLLAATPVLRWSWLAAVASTLALTIAVANLAHPLVFLAVAPLLPLVGVAASYGPGIDPTYEIALVAPLHTFRLLMLRSAAVLTTTTALSAAASLGLPDYGLRVLGWFLPALALTLLSLALTPRLGPVGAAVAVGLGWAVLLAASLSPGADRSIVFAPGGQLALALTAAVAAAMLSRLRPAFDVPRRIDRALRLGARRMQ